VKTGDVVARLLPMAAPLLDPRSRAQASTRVEAARAAGRQAHSTIARTRTALEMSQREVARLRQLHAQGAASDRTLEQAELETRAAAEALASAELGAKVADHDLKMAQSALGLWDEKAGSSEHGPMELRAPADGVILRVIAESEGVVQPGTPLLEIGDPKALELVVDVLTTDAVQIERGARAYVERWGGDETLEAHVSLVEPSAFTRLSALGVEEQRVNVVLDLDAPHERWSMLGDGYRVEVRIVIWEAKDKLLAPVSAVFRHGKGSAVYVLQKDVVRVTKVEVGRGNDEQVEILSGASEGTKVVTHPSDQLEDGSQVRPR
jgi:HlyD family secretion protein